VKVHFIKDILIQTSIIKRKGDFEISYQYMELLY